MSTVPLVVSFVAGEMGAWRIDRLSPVIGDSLPNARRLQVIEGAAAASSAADAWTLRGAVSNTRYTTRTELDALAARQEGLHRPQATRAALIPIRKNAAWWNLAQDERRAILEEQSHHIAVGLEYLPPIARRLHHSREFGEPFDFLTWFEFAPKDSEAFEELVLRLRKTAEWKYVDREVDIRLSRA
jgi:chlorite dismutase